MSPTNHVIYDGFDFADNGIVLTNINALILPDRINQIEKIAGRDGGKLVQSSRGTKPIPLKGFYDGIDAADAQYMYDRLAQMLNRQERVLEVPHAGSSRKFIATPENAVLETPDGVNRLTFSIDFVVAEGTSYTDEVTVFVGHVVSTATATIPVVVQGTVDARPVFTIDVEAGSGLTPNKSMTIRNSRDYTGITITRNWSVGDQVVIDSANFNMYINGVLTEPDGRLPKWSPGSGALFYSDTFSSRTTSIYGEYNIKYH